MYSWCFVFLYGAPLGAVIILSFYFCWVTTNNGTLKSLQLLNYSISIQEEEEGIDDNNNELLPLGRTLLDALISNTTLKESHLGCCCIHIHCNHVMISTI